MQVSLQLCNFHRHVCLRKYLLRKGVGVIGKGNDPFDPGIHQHFSTERARIRGAVQGRSGNLYAIMRCLNEGIHFGMESAAKFVPFSGRDLELLP